MLNSELEDNKIRYHYFNINSITASNGTITDCSITVYYTLDQVINVSGRIQIKDISEGIRPIITLQNKPSDMPSVSYNFISALCRRGSQANTISDPCHFLISDYKITIEQYNFSGSAPAGWLDINFG